MSEQALKILAIVFFIITYTLLLIFSKQRAYIALGAAILFVILGIMPLNKLFTVINWNLILMLAGIMGIVAIFIQSKMPAALGDLIISKTPNYKWAIILLAFFTGLLSAFIDNVATVLIMAPIAINMAKKADISPVPSVIVIAIMSNIQGAATLVGDTTSILLGAQANMNFFDFFFFKGKPGLFWIVQLSSLATVFFLLFIFRKDKQKITITQKEKITAIFPTILLLLTVILLIVASFIPIDFEFTNGLICITMCLVGVVWYAFKTKNKKQVLKTFKEINFLTLLLIASLFVVIGGIQNVGLISDIAQFLAKISKNPFVIYTIIVFASVLLSAFIDNIPYVAAMLPVIAEISLILGIAPFVLYFGLVSGATLGGNLTPIGASANITALDILRKDGNKVSTGTFMKISVPLTLIATTTGYVLIWLLFC